MYIAFGVNGYLQISRTTKNVANSISRYHNKSTYWAQNHLVYNFSANQFSTANTIEQHQNSNLATFPSDVAANRKILESAAKHLNIKELDDWYRISTKDLLHIGARDLLDQYNWLPSHLISHTFPEHSWLPWKFSSCPPNFWENVNNQIKYFKWLEIQLKIKEINDWYCFNLKSIQELGGTALLAKYNNSMFLLLVNMYPEHDWLPWKFGYCVWDDGVCEKFVKYVEKEVGMKEKSEWYSVKTKEIARLGGESMLKGKSLFSVVSKVYPEFDWLPWKFEKCPQEYWNNVENQRKFMDWAGKELKIKEMSDWYKVSQKQLSELGGFGLLLYYNNSLQSLFSQVFPEYNWLPWHFSKTVWDDVNNQIKYMQTLSNQLNIKEMSDWYKISLKDFPEKELIRKYKNSPQLLLSKMFPEYEWLPWKFNKCPKNYWDNVQNQRKYMDWAGKELKIKEMSDWYKISLMDLLKLDGRAILHKYNDSLALLLAGVYTEYEWLPWRFSNSPRSMWKSNATLRKFFDWAGNELGIKDVQDWGKVATNDIVRLGGKEILRSLSLQNALNMAYPEKSVEFSTIEKSGFSKKSQHLLKIMLKSIFPQQEVLEEFKHPDILNVSGHRLEFDFFYPKMNIAFEYQGKQHYNNLKMFHNASSQEERLQYDEQKSNLCKKNGITLIEVPYWWDRKSESLEATIYAQRPDLFADKPAAKPIPQSPPSPTAKYATNHKNIFMTATEWNPASNPTGWWMSEKYDGMRLYWNGTEFFSRNAQIKAPNLWKNQLPNVVLDGELWTRYGLYQDAVSLSKSENEDKWKTATFWVFDAPIEKPYEERVQYLKELKEKNMLPSFVKIVEPILCTSDSHLKEYFDSVIARGGEGIMLREPRSLYKVGRSESLRKFKPFFDTEVKVVENNYPHGFNCLQANGKHLFVGLSDNYEAAKRVKEGSIITVKHLGVNAYGTLQYPKFYRERTDFNWETIKT